MTSLQVLPAVTAPPAVMDRWGPLLSDPKDPVLDFRSLSISSQNTVGSPALKVQVPVSEETGSSSEEPSSPTSPCSSIDSHSGFYSLVDDPSCPEAELNTAWMVSAQRQHQLATLKEEKAFKLQTYCSSRRPRSLFLEEVGKENACNQEELRAGVGVLLQEEDRRLRQEIIRSQAPRKKPVPAAGVNLRDLELSPRDLLDSRGEVHGRVEQLDPPAARNVDNKQINFNAAMQQFLQMEQQNQQPNLQDSKRSSGTRYRTRVTQGLKSIQQQNQVQVNPDIADPGQLELQKKISTSRSKDLATNMITRSTRDHDTPSQHKNQLVQERKEKLFLSQGLKSIDDQVQVQGNRNNLNYASNLVSIQQKVETKSKNHTVRLNSSEAPQNLKGVEDNRFMSPCCPHRHSEETELLLSRVQETKGIYQDRLTSPLTSPFSHVLPPSPSSSPGSWRQNLESSGLQSRGQGTSNFIQQDIEESVRREQELQELRAARTPLKTSTPDSLEKQTSNGAAIDLNLLRPSGSLQSISYSIRAS